MPASRNSEKNQIFRSATIAKLTDYGLEYLLIREPIGTAVPIFGFPPTEHGGPAESRPYTIGRESCTVKANDSERTAQIPIQNIRPKIPFVLNPVQAARQFVVP